MIAFVLAAAIASAPLQDTAPAKPTPATQDVKAPTAVTGPVTVKRVYAATDEDTFTLTAEIDTGAPMSVESSIKAKVLKLIDDKRASVDLIASDYKGPGDAGAPEKLTMTMDERGMGDSLPGSPQIVYSMFEVCSIVPGVALKVGDSYKFDYQLPEGSVSGSGKLTDVKDVDGKKVAYLEWKGTVVPGGPEISVDGKSEVDAATGKIVKSKVTLSGGPISGWIKVEAKKKGDK